MPIGETSKSTQLATLSGFAAILLWSTTVAVARGLSEQLGPVTAAAAVFTVSAAAAFVSLLRSSERRQRILQLPPRYLLGCGTLFVGYMLLLFLAIGWAEGRHQVLEVGLVNYLWPVLTLVLSLPLLGKKGSWVLIPGTVLALAGIYLVVTQGASLSWQSPAAIFLALAAAVAWALYSNLTRRWAGGREEGAVILFLPATAIVLLLICSFLDEPREWSTRSLAEALFLGIATYAGYMLWDNAMRRGNVVLVAAVSYMTPFLSTVVSCLYLAVVPGAQLWIGCGVLILGSILSWLSVSDAPQGERP